MAESVREELKRLGWTDRKIEEIREEAQRELEGGAPGRPPVSGWWHMNSDEERQFFESWGWEYDYVNRRWFSPRDAAVVITTDEIVQNKSPGFDQWLQRVVRLHGALGEGGK